MPRRAVHKAVIGEGGRGGNSRVNPASLREIRFDLIEDKNRDYPNMWLTMSATNVIVNKKGTNLGDIEAYAQSEWIAMGAVRCLCGSVASKTAPLFCNIGFKTNSAAQRHSIPRGYWVVWSELKFMSAVFGMAAAITR